MADMSLDNDSSWCFLNFYPYDYYLFRLKTNKQANKFSESIKVAITKHHRVSGRNLSLMVLEVGNSRLGCQHD